MCQFSYAESSFIYTAPVHNNSSLQLILYLTLNHAYCNKIPIITQIILEMFLPQIRKNHKDWNQCKNSPAVNIYNIIYKIIINGPPKFSVQSFKNDSNIYKRAERWMCDWSTPLTEWGAEETAALFSRTEVPGICFQERFCVSAPAGTQEPPAAGHLCVGLRQ